MQRVWRGRDRSWTGCRRSARSRCSPAARRCSPRRWARSRSPAARAWADGLAGLRSRRRIRPASTRRSAGRRTRGATRAAPTGRGSRRAPGSRSATAPSDRLFGYAFDYLSNFGDDAARGDGRRCAGSRIAGALRETLAALARDGLRRGRARPDDRPTSPRSIVCSPRSASRIGSARHVRMHRRPVRPRCRHGSRSSSRGCSPNRMTVAFNSFWIGLLGFFLLPWTTLAWAWMYAPVRGVTGFGWFFVILGFVVDLSTYAGQRAEPPAAAAPAPEPRPGAAVSTRNRVRRRGRRRRARRDRAGVRARRTPARASCSSIATIRAGRPTPARGSCRRRR